MNQHLAVVVLGNPQSGKSTTWNRLFDVENAGTVVKTGYYPRRLYLNRSIWTEVFLISGSPQERGKPIEEILPEVHPAIVLCSVQYSETSRETFGYLLSRGYDIYVVWLNPGFADADTYADSISLVEYLLQNGCTLWQCNAKWDVEIRIQRIREYLAGWGTVRNLLTTDYLGC